jgi:hypothetical protein
MSCPGPSRQVDQLVAYVPNKSVMSTWVAAYVITVYGGSQNKLKVQEQVAGTIHDQVPYCGCVSSGAVWAIIGIDPGTGNPVASCS